MLNMFQYLINIQNNANGVTLTDCNLVSEIQRIPKRVRDDGLQNVKANFNFG